MAEKDQITESMSVRSPEPPSLTLSPISTSSNALVCTSAGNQAVQKLMTVNAPPSCFGPTDPAPTPESVEIHWNELTPWIFSVQGFPSTSAISLELYGFDITQRDPAALKPFELLGKMVRVAEPELLLPNYRARFHEAMWTQLRHDAERLEELIFDDSGIDEGFEILATWARRQSFRTQGGRTYFDTLLARLRANYWYRDYLVTTGAKHTYFDSLWDWAGSRAGEVSALISQNSVEFGAYRPSYIYAEAAIAKRSPGKEPATPVVNRELVERSADLILEKLKGRTPAGQSHVIADTVIGLPGPEQSHVLKEIMSRYDERNWIGLGRYGEASEGGMLYWLFEDLTSDDRDRMSASLVNSGVFTQGQAATLVEGRGPISRVLPWTTGKIGQLAEERVKYWADKAVNEDSKMAYLWGTIDSLMLPQTIDTTVLTIVGAKVPGAIANVSRVAGAGLAILGSGYMGYETGINVQKLINRKDPYTGKELDTGELLSSALSLGSNILFAAAAGMEMRRPGGATDLVGRPAGDTPSLGPTATAAVGEELVAPAARSMTSASPEVRNPTEWRVLNFDSNTGDITAIGRSGDDHVVVRINSRTLDGELIHPRTGRVLPIRGGIPTEVPQLSGSTAPSQDIPSASSRTPQEMPKIEGAAPRPELPAAPMTVGEQTTRVQELLAKQQKIKRDLRQADSNQKSAGRTLDSLQPIKDSTGLNASQQARFDKANDSYNAARKTEDSLRGELQRTETELTGVRRHAVQPTSWQEHESSVYQRQVADHPGASVGEQVRLDVTDVATNTTVEIQIDVAVFENGELKLVDAKFSAQGDLTRGNIGGVYTPNQSLAYRWISGGNRVVVVPRGPNAANMELKVGTPVKVSTKVEVHVNSPEGIQVRDFKDTI